MRYCKTLLTKRKPNESFEEDIEMKKMIHEERMHQDYDKNEELTRKQFEETWKILKSTKKGKYEFIFKAGDSLKEGLFNLFSKIWITEELPASWDITSLIQLFKGSGSVEEPSNYRNIHIKSEFGKMFSHLVLEKAKRNLTENMSVFQTAKPGHRCQENLYVLKSVMASLKENKEANIRSFMDLEKFFDKELLVDVLDEAHLYIMLAVYVCMSVCM